MKSMFLQGSARVAAAIRTRPVGPSAVLAPGRQRAAKSLALLALGNLSWVRSPTSWPRVKIRKVMLALDPSHPLPPANKVSGRIGVELSELVIKAA